MSGRRVWGEKCVAVLFSRAALSMQVLEAGSVVPESRMKTVCAMGRDVRAGVQTARNNRTVGGV
jgi:hypothetical protein